MRISDWSSDVCSSDLPLHLLLDHLGDGVLERLGRGAGINGVDRDRRRSDRRELGYREPQERQTANQHDHDGAEQGEDGDRKSVVWGKSVTERVDLGGCSSMRKKKLHVREVVVMTINYRMYADTKKPKKQ